eukprot:185012-Pelagomonas_calceolata.AAC.1
MLDALGLVLRGRGNAASFQLQLVQRAGRLMQPCVHEYSESHRCTALVLAICFFLENKLTRLHHRPVPCYPQGPFTHAYNCFGSGSSARAADASAGKPSGLSTALMLRPLLTHIYGLLCVQVGALGPPLPACEPSRLATVRALSPSLDLEAPPDPEVSVSTSGSSS